MKRNIKAPLAPYNYPRCFNAKCAQANQCLHRLAAIHDTPDEYTTLIINPLRLPEEDKPCPEFQSAEKKRVAWGIKHLFDELPYKVVYDVKHTLISHFGKNMYYCFYREEKFLSLQDQAFIRETFHEYGIKKEPTFEAYSEEYIW